MREIPKIFSKQKAQTAMELAIFGAILIFMLGTIIRQAMGFSYLQNNNLKAMRMAMLKSFRHSEGWDGPHPSGNASRNSATVIYVSDTLSVSADRFGSIERAPQVSQGSATHSRNLFMPTKYGNDYNLPVVDMYINGRHFVFTIAEFRHYTLANVNPPHTWNPNCTADAPPGGCYELYTRVPNYDQIKRWCWHDGPHPDGGDKTDCTLEHPVNLLATGPGTFVGAASRFDLNRDGVLDPLTEPTTDDERRYFAWHWYAIMGFSLRHRQKQHLAMGEGIYVEAEDCDEDCLSNKNDMVDVDYDMFEERILKLSSFANGRIQTVSVIDYQAGDMDFGMTTSDPRPRPGLTNEMQMYAFLKDGTYLLIEEGKVFQMAGDSKQYIRSVQKNDHIDVITRVIQITNNTWKFCPGGAGGPPRPNVNYATNPVEACGNCFIPANLTKTCLDIPNKKIYVRSRIADRYGRKWITDVENYDYTDFYVPPIP